MFVRERMMRLALADAMRPGLVAFRFRLTA
jgi:hypothetical protein